MTSKKQGKNRSRLRRIIDNRRAKRAASGDYELSVDLPPLPTMPSAIAADDVVITPVTGLSAVPVTVDMISSYRDDSNECWAAAKRRKQGKLKTWALWQTHMEERGYFFRTEDNVLSVYKDGFEVGQVSIFGTAPDV